MEIGSKIKELRLQRGLTQEELASRCELTKGYISQLENDIASPSIATLKDILNILGCRFMSSLPKKRRKIVFSRQDFLSLKTVTERIFGLYPIPKRMKWNLLYSYLRKGLQ